MSSGVEVETGCVGNTIGGTASGAGNVISANGYYGVWIYGDGATENLVQGNRIGTDFSGTAPLGNASSGVLIDSGASSNTVGGTTVGAGNLISANGYYGVWITGDGATENLVQGNRIGTDFSGTAPLGNASSGVLIDSGASSNTVGGTAWVPAT